MLFTVLHVLAATGVAFAAQQQLVKVTNFGTNPTGVGMCECSGLCGASLTRLDVYKPSKLANPPPLLVAMHYCGGSGPGYFSCNPSLLLRRRTLTDAQIPSMPTKRINTALSSSTQMLLVVHSALVRGVPPVEIQLTTA